jgi:hypothetical protein
MEQETETLQSALEKLHISVALTSQLKQQLELSQNSHSLEIIRINAERDTINWKDRPEDSKRNEVQLPSDITAVYTQKEMDEILERLSMIKTHCNLLMKDQGAENNALRGQIARLETQIEAIHQLASPNSSSGKTISEKRLSADHLDILGRMEGDLKILGKQMKIQLMGLKRLDGNCL